MEKLESQKGKDLLLSEGFCYHKARFNADGSVHRGDALKQTVMDPCSFVPSMISEQLAAFAKVSCLPFKNTMSVFHIPP